MWTDTQAGTSVSGQSVTVQAGQNLTLTAASLVGTDDVNLSAGGNVSIQNALDTVSTLNTKSVVTTGLISSGFNVMLGQTSQTLSQASTQQLVAGSTVGSVVGNLTVAANQNLTVTGSDLIAGANLTLSGKNVTVAAGYDLLTATQTETSSSAGISAGLGGSLGGALNQLYGDIAGAQNSTDSRLTALKGVQAAYGAAQLAGVAGDPSQSVENLNQAEGIQVQVSIGASSSKNVTTVEQSVAQGSNLTAGGTLILDATAGNVTVTGSNLTGQNILLAATGDVTLNAAQSTSTTNASNSSGGWNVGVSFGVTDEEAGLGVFANGYAASGKANGTGTINDNTTVTAGQSLTISAGNDVTLAGAQAKGNDIILNAGNDLNLVSLQDTNNYKSNQQSMSGGVAVSESGASGSASYSQSTVTSNFASVNQQTGLYAGSGGFQIDVGNNTNLTGAVIASSAPAGDNSLTTNTLSFSDILNKANYSASTIGGSFSSSGGLAGNALANGASLLGSLTGPGGNASGTTLSAISAGTINVLSGGSTAGLSRDTTGANGSIAPIFNLQQIQNNQAVGQAFGQIANNIAGDVIAASGWSEDSTQGILLHGLVGAMQGQISGGNALAGAAGGAASAALAPAMAQYLVSQGLDPNSDEFKQLMQAGSQIVGTAIGAAVGAASGTGAQSGALTGGQASLSSTTNNYLKHDQLTALSTAQATLQACSSAPESCTAEQVSQAQSQVNDLQAIDKKTDDALINTCAQGNSPSCLGAMAQFQAASQTYVGISPEDPAYADGLKQFAKNNALSWVVKNIVANNETADLGAITNAFGTGAVVGATTAVAAVVAVAGGQAATTVAQACGTSPACYAYFANAALSDVVAAAPEIGGTGVVGAALGTALQEAKAAISGDQAAATLIGTAAGAKGSSTIPAGGSVGSDVSAATSTTSTAGGAANNASTGSEIIDGAGGATKISPPNTIPYSPTSSLVNQGNAPVCGPACCCMVINDATGKSVDLSAVVNQFPEVRPTGVDINEMSTVLSGNGIVNTTTTTLSTLDLKAALNAGDSAIVQVNVPSGGYHFVIVDGTQTVDGTTYYLTRDPLSGARGVNSDIFNNLISGNAILLGGK